jgi:hypothetical protein
MSWSVGVGRPSANGKAPKRGRGDNSPGHAIRDDARPGNCSPPDLAIIDNIDDDAVKRGLSVPTYMQRVML